MITIVNYGMGNLGSVQNMFKRINVKSEVASDIAAIEKAEKILLPGVGAFGNAIDLIDTLKFREVILHKVVEQKVPIMGICLGMQLLTKGSEESPRAEGLGLIDADTLKFKFDDNTLKIPHMGWNLIRTSKSHPLVENLPEEPRFYFVHSYYVKLNKQTDQLASTHYGNDFTSMIQKDNVMGAQFHPEKSHKFGMKILENFAKL